MKQIYPLVALAVLLAAGIFFVSNFQVTTDQPGGPQIRPREDGSNPTELPFGLGQQDPAATARPSSWSGQQPSPNLPISAPGQQRLGGDMVRIASFNIQVFGEQKMSNPDVVRVLADILTHFDVIAIQEIRDERQTVLPSFLQVLNRPGLRFDYVIGPRLGRTSSKEQYAFIFNTDTIEVDRRAMYTLADPDDLLHREPLVASFRCRRAEPNLAFTFTLVNIHTDPTPQTLREELTVLDDVFRSVRDDPRGEDDIILVGDFNADHLHMGELSRVPNLLFAATYASNNKLLATNITGKAQYDNLVFDRTATQEFLGRSGVFDFLREYNLSQAQAKQVSDHLPVWAEFSVYEGGVPGRVAISRPATYAQQRPGQRREPYYEEQPVDSQPYFDPYAAQSPEPTAYYDDRRLPEFTADPRNPGDGFPYATPAGDLPRRSGRW